MSFREDVVEVIKISAIKEKSVYMEFREWHTQYTLLILADFLILLRQIRIDLSLTDNVIEMWLY